MFPQASNMRLLILLTIFNFINCEVAKKYDILEKNRMVGIDTVHEGEKKPNDIKIDKDTIITRNLNLDTKNRAKNARHHKAENNDPDWSYSQFPPEVAAHVQQFKLNMTECLKEVQANDKRPVKRLSPKHESPVQGECLIACVLKRNGVIANMKINRGNLLTLVSKFYAKDTKLMKKLDKNLDRCIESSARIRDECTLAAHLNECTNGLMASNKHKITVNY